MLWSIAVYAVNFIWILCTFYLFVDEGKVDGREQTKVPKSKKGSLQKLFLLFLRMCIGVGRSVDTRHCTKFLLSSVRCFRNVFAYSVELPTSVMPERFSMI